MPATPLPAVTQPATIDGYTQPCASPNTLINGDNAVLVVELSGESLAGTPSGLDITAGGTTVRGLVINRFAGTGIRIGVDGGNIVAGNFLGTDVTDLTPAGAGDGEGVTISGTPGNTVGGASTTRATSSPATTATGWWSSARCQPST